MTTAETGFSRWMRSRKDLDSEMGVVCCDMDYPVLRYKTACGRTVQCVMFVEVKTHGKEPDLWQQDLLCFMDQFLNNRRTTPTKKNLKRQAALARTKVYSAKLKTDVTCWAFGGYLLQFEKTGPDDSDWIKWGPRRREITEDQLAALLRFDLDPDTLGPLEIRSHHATAIPPLLSGIPLDAR
jgi:hypothetical protein